jgi:uncharacterized Zn-binding protein involved in type VI secretion
MKRRQKYVFEEGDFKVRIDGVPFAFEGTQQAAVRS